MKLLRFSNVVFLLFLAVYTFGQEPPTGYNPFVPKNLDDSTKLIETPVVESSIHRYWIHGDPNYKDTSTYVWYVENGSFVEFDTISRLWIPMFVQGLGNGQFVELKGMKVDTTKNASEIWVRWNDGTGGNSNGYIAVYERSGDNCIVPDKISGFKHKIVLPPEVWFVEENREECADQLYSVILTFNNINDYSFPYTLSYSYPGSDGLPKTAELKISSMADFDVGLTYILDLIPVHDLDVSADEIYKVKIEKLIDNFESNGKIAPLGPPQQYSQFTLTIFHLPQTGGMTMD
jgi:hypothetical protein